MSIKSELTKTASYLRSARKAIAGRGGEISATAGLKDLPTAIFNIPADSSLGYYSDNTVAYKKTTLANAKENILLNEIGGMTYKSANLLNPAFFDATKEIASGLTITNNGDGSLVINGAGEVSAYQTEYNVLPLGSPRIYGEGVYLSIDKLLPENMAILVWTYATSDPNDYSGESFHWLEGDITSLSLYNWIGAIFITGSTSSASGGSVSADNVIIKPMLSRGSVKPYEPYFEGLRSSKVTALKVHGANLLDASKCVNKCFVDNGDGTYTIKGVGTDRFSGYAPVHIPANTYFYITAKTLQEASKLVGILAKLADGTEQSVRTLSEGAVAKKFNSDVVSIRFYIQGAGTSADGVSGVYSDFWLSLANVGYFPYKSEPTTYALPEAVKNLPLFGHGVTDSNTKVTHAGTVDFDNEQYINPLKKLVLDGVSEGKKATKVQQLNGYNNFLLAIDGTYASPRALDITHFNVNYANNAGNAYLIGAQLSLFPYDQTLTTLPTFNAWLKEMYDKGTPVECVYAVAEPEVTDISAELAGFDPFIYVEPTGEIEFVNEYENAVPSTITYVVKAGS